MALYSALVPVIEATQWHRNGSHPEDRTIHGLNQGRIVKRHPSVNDPEDKDTICRICNEPMYKHGVLNPAIQLNASCGDIDVCPGDYIVTHREDSKKGRVLGYTVYKRQLFEHFYGPYQEIPK